MNGPTIYIIYSRIEKFKVKSENNQSENSSIFHTFKYVSLKKNLFIKFANSRDVKNLGHLLTSTKNVSSSIITNLLG